MKTSSNDPRGLFDCLASEVARQTWVQQRALGWLGLGKTELGQFDVPASVAEALEALFESAVVVNTGFDLGRGQR